MKKLAVLLAIFCMSAVLSQAATTIVVTHGGTPHTYTTMASAGAAFAAGDTMDIQDFDGPLVWNTPTVPTGCTLKCTKAGAKATIQSGSDPSVHGGFFGHLENNTYQNLIIDGSNGGYYGLYGGLSSTVTNCTIEGFSAADVYLCDGSKTGGVQDPGVTITNCYLVAGSHCIDFGNGYGGIVSPATITNKAIINHCTIVGLGGALPWNVEAYSDGLDIKSLYSLQNSIISTRHGDCAITYAGAGLTDAPTQVDEDYNLFDCDWHIFYGQGGGSSYDSPVGAHSAKINVNGTDPEIFTNNAGGDYTLNTTAGNPAVGTGSGGTNKGVYLTLVPVELSNFSAE
jgi:hypothetical protein